jgi:hypothetical protein
LILIFVLDFDLDMNATGISMPHAAPGVAPVFAHPGVAGQGWGHALHADSTTYTLWLAAVTGCPVLKRGMDENTEDSSKSFTE